VCLDIPDHGGEPRIFVAKRKADRRIYPNLLEGCGGRLRYGESFQQGVRRHYVEEAGLVVHVFTAHHRFYTVQDARDTHAFSLPGVRFLCVRVDGPASATPPPQHEWQRWLTLAEVRKLSAQLFIPGVREQMIELVTGFLDKA
jgi:8-oxo-dGTP pyrophosphatase MutT (NUDIX family)